MKQSKLEGFFRVQAAAPRPAKKQKSQDDKPVTVEVFNYADIQKLETRTDVVDLIIDFQPEKDDMSNADLLFSLPVDTYKGKDHILDLRGFKRLKTLTLKERTGNIRFKHVGEDPESTNRMQLALPTNKKNLLQVKFWWVAHRDSGNYEGLTTKLRTVLHQDETKHVEEWVRDRGMTKRKLFSESEMEEKKMKQRFESLKAYSDQIPELQKLPFASGPLEEGEMVLVLREKLLDETLEFDVLEVANSTLRCKYQQEEEEKDLQKCVEDRKSTWIKKWTEDDPAGFLPYEKVNCFYSASGLGITSVPRKRIFRTLPAVPDYRSKVSEMRGHLYCEQQSGVVLQLKRATAPKLLPCPACQKVFKCIKDIKDHIKQISDANPVGTHVRVLLKHDSMLEPDGPSLSIEHAVKGTGWETPLGTLADGRSSRSECVRPKTQSHYDKSSRDIKAKAEKLEDAQYQVEYYISDKNLKHDTFYRGKIMTSNDGWFQMCHIMTAPRIKTLTILTEDLSIALMNSESVETKKDQGGTYWIRRKGGKKLPPYKPRSSYRHGNRRYSDGMGDSDYGFDGGCMGYSGRDCDTLLECGVKPWDDDAGMVLGAMHDY